MKKYELSAQEIYKESFLSDEDLTDLPKDSPILGQTQALEAIQFGAKIKAGGYNVFCTGPKGVGRTVLTLQSLKEFATTQKTPDDWCFIHNFEMVYAVFIQDLIRFVRLFLFVV